VYDNIINNNIINGNNISNVILILIMCNNNVCNVCVMCNSNKMIIMWNS